MNLAIQSHSKWRMWIFLCGLVFAVGCSNAQPWEKTNPASGAVSWKGQPVADADITLFPIDSTIPDTVRPQAKTVKDGKFVLGTYTNGDGVPAGTYKVTLVRQQVAVSKGTIVAKPNDLPGAYAKRDTTPLRITICEGQNVLPAFELR
jgi:hypothetical protein